MPNFMEKFFGRKKTQEQLAQEPIFEDLCNALPAETQEEFRELAKEFGGEEGRRTTKFNGNYDGLSLEERRFNELLNKANKEYYGVGSEE
jgi:hypothetical protein